MHDFNRVRQICVKVAKVDERTWDQETAQRITALAGTIPLFPDPITDPKKIERDVDQIIADIRSLRKRIGALDNYARSYARRAARRDDYIAICDEMSAAEDAPEAMEQAIKRFNEYSQMPQSEWVDFAALKHIDALEAAMRDLGAQAIARTPQGAGRPKNKHAHDVAFAAAKIFLELTGEHPGFWNEGSTPFTRMLEELFSELGIKAGLRGPVEAAMQKLTPDG